MSTMDRPITRVDWSAIWWERSAPYLMLAGGLLALVVSFAAGRLLGGTAPGFGHSQTLLALVGAGLLGGGVAALAVPTVFSRRDVTRFLAVTLQLGLVCLVIHRFQLENPSLHETLTILVVGGFVVHYFLPASYRLAFFVALSLAAIVAILGLSGAAWLVGVGLVLIGICHLPVRFAMRVALLIASGVLLTALRVGAVNAPWPTVVWPILGSMFMFRLIIYAFDLRKGKNIGGPKHALAYFFLLPNAAFPLFPVVDYGTFVRTYYNEDQHRIYQRGVRWMFRGTLQLLVYRFIYDNFMVAPGQVQTLAQLATYLVTSYLFLLRLSGQFHLIVGMLLLFGFNLPRTFNLYYLADSFTDVWSRANIYWKEFMKKVFYFPTFFRLNTVGRTGRILAGTVIVILATWFLHAYQWFWILGNFRVSGPDLLFWTSMGTLLGINALRDAKPRLAPARHRDGVPEQPPLRRAVARALRIVGTFSVMCVLWSLYNAPSLSAWLALRSIAAVTVLDVVWLASLMAAGVLVLTAAARAQWLSRLSLDAEDSPRRLMRLGLPALLTVSFLLLAASPVIAPMFGTRIGGTLRDLRLAKLNAQDAALLTEGYYENLMNVGRLNSQVWEVYLRRPKKERMWDTEAGQATGDYLKAELRPSASITFQGATFTTNRWGMRDRDYELTKSPGTFRIALLGTSSEVGWGVGDHEVFEQLVEDRLNDEAERRTHARYEILNFSVPSYTVSQQLLVLANKVPPFAPDAVMLVAHDLDPDRAIDHLVKAWSSGVPIPFDSLRHAVEVAAADSAPEDVIRRRLLDRRFELLSWMYRQITGMSRQQGALPVWVFLPALQSDLTEAEVSRLRHVARDAGFVILDLADIYRGRDRKALMMAEWDYHPNVNGHAIIAARLYQAMRANAPAVFGGAWGTTRARTR